MRNIFFAVPRLSRLDETPDGTLCLFHFKEKRPFTGMAGLIDWRLLGRLSALVIDGFLSGETDEILLFPPGNRLPQQRILLFGLGERSAFCRSVFEQGVKKMINTVDKISDTRIIATLPGRPQGECDTVDAIEWFLDIYDELGLDRDVTILEPSGAQKAMLPSVERWRLKHSVPPEAMK